MEGQHTPETEHDTAQRRRLVLDKVSAEVAEDAAATGVEGAAEFVRCYFARTRVEDLEDRSVADLARAALDHLALGLQRQPGSPALQVLAGEPGGPTRVDVVTDDMPFLIDSVRMELTRHHSPVRLIVHPALRVRRDPEGRLTALQPDEGAPGEGVRQEAWIHLEIDRRVAGEDAEALVADLRRVLRDVRAAVEDWRPMRQRALDIAAELEQSVDAGAAPVDPEETRQAAALLRWLADDHFVFLGYREYELVGPAGGEELRGDPGSGLGLLRPGGTAPEAHRLAGLPLEVRRQARQPILLNLTNANSRSTVHRSNYLDYVGVKQIDASGRVLAERRFLGLYTASVYKTHPRDIPMLRDKVAEVERRAGLDPESHDGKALVDVLATFPRGEMLQTDVDALTETVLGILDLQERPEVRLFVRRDTFGRFFSCLVFVPREGHTTEVRERMQDVLLNAFHGRHLEYTLRVSESVLARLHFVIYPEPGAEPAYDVATVERELARAARTWTDEFAALLTAADEPAGTRHFDQLREAFSVAYREDFLPTTAVRDLRRLRALRPRDDMSLALYRPSGAAPDNARLKVYRTGSPLALSDVLPALENMGVRVVDERPYRVSLPERPPAFVYDFGLRCADACRLDAAALQDQFAEAFLRTWRGELDNDGFQRLVLHGGLTWRQVTILRAYAKYQRQVGSNFSQAYVEDTLTAHAPIARALVDLFEARFDPARAPATGAADPADRLVPDIQAALDEVASLDQDRILRAMLRLVCATVRTNYFQGDAEGRVKPYLSLKLDPAKVPDLPPPRPEHEIFVYSPRVEGVHLRGGTVARGGLRWSDRREDFRTEVLGLMKAQMDKNAVIVPVGAKGGFVVKRPPTRTGDAAADREALQAEGVACYRTFIRGLLDVTDNIVEGRVVPPRDVVRMDGDDAYLVVAADKGTATFSDLANEVALDYAFWLGDAFASGGSSGYDHKTMGITARGAWESVRRHFRDLGVDVDTEPITAVGIGDMSGDVLGNGMLQSSHLRLVAAFDHRHVFLDPNPDPAASFAERQRLFDLPRSSWADYDRTVISAGGGVYPRTAKSIRLSPEARAALGVQAQTMTPNQLVSAVLRAPVDLLWNGGIGTYVKAHGESQADVGDKANDAVRVDGADLRCRVVGEGGNLGFTQRGRVEYALAGGRLFTDAIDNSAGVDCSDHEVNIKILLNGAMDAGLVAPEERDPLLAAMTDEVARLVLADNVNQTRALANARSGAAAMLDVHERYLVALEGAGRLDRGLEALPDEEEFARRRSVGAGLTSPELAVLLSHTKNLLYREILDSDLPDDPAVHDELVEYFPHALRERAAAIMDGHRLHREIIATALANRVVNRGGVSFLFRLQEETGATQAEIARAHLTAAAVFDTDTLLAELEAVPGVPAETRTAMVLESRTLVERASRWLLRHRPSPLDIQATVAAFRPAAQVVLALQAELLTEADRFSLGQVREGFVAAGVPTAVAERVVARGPLFSALSIAEVARRSGRSIEDSTRVWFALGERLALDWLRVQVAALPRTDRWQVLARDAVRDDLYAERSALTEAALRDVPVATDGDGEAERRVLTGVDAWLARHSALVERSRRLLADVQAAEQADLAVVSVALRELRLLLQAGESAGAPAGSMPG